MTRNRVKILADARGLLEISFGLLTFAALVYVLSIRVSRSTHAEEYLYWVHYFVVRAVLSGLMVYAGIKSWGKNPAGLFGLNMGIGLASLFVGIMNILECTIAGGDWKDVVAVVLYLPASLIILWITLYIRKRNKKVEEQFIS